MFLTVDVKPGQREEKLIPIGENHYEAHVKAPARRGRANKALIRLVRDTLGLQATIVRGHTSSRKLLRVEPL